MFLLIFKYYFTFFCSYFFFFFFNDTATTEIYTLSLHDALPISEGLKGLVEALRRIGVEAARVCDPAQRSLSPPESEAIPCIAGHLRPLHREVLRSFDLTAYEVRLAQERCEPAARVAGSELPQLLDGPL